MVSRVGNFVQIMQCLYIKINNNNNNNNNNNQSEE